MGECKACLNVDRAEVEREIWLGQVTVADAAKRFGMTYEDYWNHLKNHIEIDKEKVDTGDLSQILRYLVKRLKSRCDSLMSLQVNPNDERSISSQVRLLKDIVMDIAKLEHQLSESPVISIQNIMMQQTEIVSFLTGNLCLECKKKVMEYLAHGQELVRAQR